MTPELRAIADRFMYETATLKHILALLPDGAADRTVRGHQDGWTIRQLVAHLAEALHTYTGFLDNLLAGNPPDQGLEAAAIDSPMSDPDVPLVEVSRRFDSGIRVLLDCFEGIPDEKLGDPAVPMTNILHSFEGHALGDVIPLIDAAPELRMDPLVLNWLLYASFDADSDRAWQRALLQEAREYAAGQPQEEEA